MDKSTTMKPSATELNAALCEWRAALLRFDTAEDDIQAEFTAMQVEAAGRRYSYLLARYKGDDNCAV